MLRPTTAVRSVPRASARLIFPALLFCVLAIGGFVAPASGELEAGPQFQVSDADATSGYVFENRPSVAADAVGNFVVVWEDFETYPPPYGTRIRGQRFASDGTPRGDAFRVGNVTAEYAYRQFQPSVAADADGDFVVVWSDGRGYYEGSSIQGRRFAADGMPRDDQFQVNSVTTGSNSRSQPSVAADADGDFVVVWSYSRGSYEGSVIYGRRFAADGAPGDHEFLVNDTTPVPAGLTNPSVLAAGLYHNCTIDDEGVTCWGNDDFGQSTVPAGLTNPTAIAAGEAHTYAIDDNGVTCWGYNLYCESTVPAGLTNPTTIAAGGSHTCAIDDNGVICWGDDRYGQSTVPAGLTNASAVAVGLYHTCAIDDNGVACWGAGGPGGSGFYDLGQSTVPAGLTNASVVAAGLYHTCAIDDNGVTCWGFDGLGQSTVPAGLTDASAVAAGGLHTCAIDDNGVTCWGAGGPGGSGFYDRGQSTVPAGLVNPSVVAAGGLHTCAIDDNGVTCWGDERYQRFAPREIEPSVALDADGDFVVVWRDYQDYYGRVIRGHRFAADGTPAGPSFRVSSNTIGAVIEGQPSVAADADGDFVVVWREIPHLREDSQIKGRRFASDGAPDGPEFQVSSDTDYYEREPSVAAGADGDFVVVWRGYPYDESDYSVIQGQHFASDGTPDGPQFQASSATDYPHEREPSIAADAGGDFVVVWRGFQEGPPEGALIQGRQFSVIGPPAIEVEIDIKPGSDANPINASGRGLMPVAILGSDTFDVESVDVTTLAFGPNGIPPTHDLTKAGAFADHLKDANDDGFTDLVNHYRTQEVGFAIESEEACISGGLLDGTPFEGCDGVKVWRGKRPFSPRAAPSAP